MKRIQGAFKLNTKDPALDNAHSTIVMDGIGRKLANEVGSEVLKYITIHTHTDDGGLSSSVDFFVISKEKGDHLLKYLQQLQRQKTDIVAQVISEDLLKLLLCENL